MQFANRVKKAETKKQNTHKKNRKFLRNLDSTPDKILKVRGQMFLRCRGYL